MKISCYSVATLFGISITLKILALVLVLSFFKKIPSPSPEFPVVYNKTLSPSVVLLSL